jgi:predicted phage tail protein
MRKGIMSGVLVALLTLVATVASASVSITASGGWFESAYVEFSTDGSAYYNVYYSTNKSSWTKIDDQLVRKYGSSKGRADVVGISAGTYYIKVASVNSSGSETSNTVSSALTVKAHDRAGFAHLN